MSLDAVFVIHDEIPTLQEFWQTFTKTRQLLGGTPALESFRFAHESPLNVSAQNWLLEHPSTHRGHLFSANPDDAFTTALSAAVAECTKHDQNFRLTLDRFPKQRDIELVLNHHQPTISLYFEDRVENTLRFMRRFKSALARYYKIKEDVVEAELEKFHTYCQSEVHSTQAYTMMFKKGLFAQALQPVLQLQPIWSTVGRHTIFEKLYITLKPTDSVKELVDLFVEFSRAGQANQATLYFQYFRAHVLPALQMKDFDPYKLETTYDFQSLLLTDVEALMGILIQETLSDFFMVATQDLVENIAEKPSLIYTLRKIPERGFELRANLTWENTPQKEPEELIAPMEKASGFDWYRLV